MRYIHLNPLRAGLVQNADELETCPYSGHSVLIGRSSNDWQAVDTVLSLFGGRPSPARRAYRLYKESLERRYRLKAKGIDLDAVIERVAEAVGIDAELIRNPGKQPLRAEAGSIACYLAVGHLRMSTVAVSKVLGISPTGVTKAVTRGKMHAQRRAINLDE